MIGLPKYVHAKRKGGRVGLAYQKFRGTEKAWPRVQLPSDPASVEFVTRAKLCDALTAEQSGETWRWRFVDITNRQHDLPDPRDSKAFWAAVEKADRIGKQIAAGDKKTFSALILEFKASNAFRLKGDAPAAAAPVDDEGDRKKKNGKRKKKRNGISKSTRDQYARHMRDIEAAWGDDPVSALTTVDAQRAIDAFEDTPSAGRAFRATLSRLIDWGIPRGYRDDNPVEKTERPPEDGTYEPWPPWAFELFFEYARPALHLPVYSAIFTGQRLVDVVKMQRPLEGAIEMPLVAQKTSALIPVQIHSEYRGLIAAAKPAEGHNQQMLHLREDGEAWTYEGIKTAWQRQMDLQADLYSEQQRRTAAAAMLRFREHRLVFHGLRKNAVNMLLEVGCNEERVAAIVGMSPAMVHHYSKRVNKFRLARDAMRILESAWEAHRPKLLGGVRVVK